MAGQPAAVSDLLRSWSRGDIQARDQLVPLVYRELKRRAAAYLRSDHTDGNGDISLLEIGRGVLTKFTFDPSMDNAPIWSPDGRTHHHIQLGPERRERHLSKTSRQHRR
jgi:hypothetical protein